MDVKNKYLFAFKKRKVDAICSVCHKVFTDPRKLPCEHLFCKVCLLHHLLTTANREYFHCPNANCPQLVKLADPCAPLHEWAEGYTRDKTLLHIKDRDDGETEITCSLCFKVFTSGGDQVNFCEGCQEFICEECVDQHTVFRPEKDRREWLESDVNNEKQDDIIRAKPEYVFSAKHRDISRRDPADVENRPPEEETQTIIGEELVCFLTGVCFMDGNIVIADRKNKRVSILDDKFIVRSAYNMSCYDVIEMDGKLVVSVPVDHCLRVLTVKDGVMEEEAMISVGNNDCFGLCRAGDNFVTTVVGEKMQLNMYNGTTLVEEIPLENGEIPFERPRYITYHAKSDRFFVSDNTAGCLKSIERNGSIVWEQELPLCHGLTVLDDYLLVTRFHQSTVDLLNIDDGVILKSIVTPEDSICGNLRVLSVDEQSSWEDGKKLVVVDFAEFVHVFLLSDPLREDFLKLFMHEGKGQGLVHRDVLTEREKKNKPY